MACKQTTLLLLVVSGLLCVASTTAAEERRPNVLLICVDDLRPELGCYGVNYVQSPNIDRLASNGTVFRRHYVQAPTCGASRFALLTGRYGGARNDALFLRAVKLKQRPSEVPPSMPAWFRNHGYRTASVGKVSHHPGGCGGVRWNEQDQLEMPNSWDRQLLPTGDWNDPRGWMHGLANGEIRSDVQKTNGGIEMDVYQTVDGPDSIYPDGISVNEALHQMDLLVADSNKPFFLAVGILRPHLPFGCPEKYLDLYSHSILPPTPYPSKPSGRTTWHRSGEFMKYNRWERDPRINAEFAVEVRKHYAACVSYADAQVGKLLNQLKQSGAANDTIVVLWGDHGWHLGEHSVWGKHTLFEESLRAPLIIHDPRTKRRSESTEAIVESIDVFPTLCELTGVAVPDFVHGVSLRTMLNNPSTQGHSAISYKPKAKTIRTDAHRLIMHEDGYVELYDHSSEEKETRNLATEILLPNLSALNFTGEVSLTFLNSRLVDDLTEKLEAKSSRD